MVRVVEAKLKGQLKLQQGSKVQVHGLEKQKELNGLVGHLLEFDAVKMRWGVELSNGKKVSLKMGNFLPVDADVSPCEPPGGFNATLTEEPPTSDQLGVSGYETAAQESAVASDVVSTCEHGAIVAEPGCAEAADTVSKTGEPVPTPCDADDDTSSQVEAAQEAAPPAINDEDWPVLPTSAETAAKMRSGCWFDGGSAAKRFTEQLLANDPALVSVCLVPPKRFNEDDAREICSALEKNECCTELVASGHPLSAETCTRLADLLAANSTLQTLSIGDSTFGGNASTLFAGLAQNISLSSLDLEHKGLTAAAFTSLAQALAARQNLGASPLTSLKLSRNVAVGGALSELSSAAAPAELFLCECALAAEHGENVGRWISHGVQKLDLRDNSRWGSEGLERLMATLLPAKSQSTPLLTLRLDGCSIGDDGLEVIADACGRGLQLEELFVERCEITQVGCELLEQALRGQRLRTLSARSNVIGDEGCSLLARCAENLDLSSTSLSGQVLTDLGKQPLVSLELFSNPSLGPSIRTWWGSLDSGQWQRLEHLDLSGCELKDEGFECVVSSLMDRLELMPALSFLCLGANSLTEDDAKCERVEELGEARGGKLRVVWQSA